MRNVKHNYVPRLSVLLQRGLVRDGVGGHLGLSTRQAPFHQWQPTSRAGADVLSTLLAVEREVTGWSASG